MQQVLANQMVGLVPSFLAYRIQVNEQALLSQSQSSRSIEVLERAGSAGGCGASKASHASFQKVSRVSAGIEGEMQAHLS